MPVPVLAERLDADTSARAVVYVNIERACEVMHDAYEKAAVGAGWKTNPASRKPWADVPEANKATMRAAVAALMNHLATEVEFSRPEMGSHILMSEYRTGKYDGLTILAAQLRQATIYT